VTRRWKDPAIVNLLDTRVAVMIGTRIPRSRKSMLLTLTRMLALELAPKVVVNGVAPGSILPPPGYGVDYLTKLTYANPLNRHGDPQDIADAVLFLVRSRFITGQVIYVDGGMHMKGRIYD
jgi:NAD(P)-dependent dehydrogenase (short-subunit alcohol dehydrogenase family)